ncbi:hypothetical protein J3F84DRAFT_50607 [Trichoderma pleuroticola]
MRRAGIVFFFLPFVSSVQAILVRTRTSSFQLGAWCVSCESKGASLSSVSMSEQVIAWSQLKLAAFCLGSPESSVFMESFCARGPFACMWNCRTSSSTTYIRSMCAGSAKVVGDPVRA